MNYSDFLPQWKEDDPDRKLWWDRSQKAEMLARQCVGAWGFANLSKVVLTPDKTCWCPDGTLNVTATSLYEGAVYHELFHPVLHQSPFTRRAQKNVPNYELYCEGLCNAFEYFMEQMIGPQGNVTKKVTEWKGKRWAEIIAMSGCLPWDMVYGLPAFEFVNACATFAEFKKMVHDLNNKS